MTREEYDLKMSVFIDKTITKDSLSNMFGIINMYIASLEANIEAQEIIIKDKTVIIEDMEQPKTKNIGDLSSYLIIPKIRGKL